MRKKSKNKLVVPILIVVIAFFFFSYIRNKSTPKELLQPNIGNEQNAKSQEIYKSKQAENLSLEGKTDLSDPAENTLSEIEIEESNDALSEEARAGVPANIPPEFEQQLNTPPLELPEDLRREQLEAPPPSLPPDLAAQINAPPPEIPEDIKRALNTPPRIVSIDEVNNPAGIGSASEAISETEKIENSEESQ